MPPILYASFLAGAILSLVMPVALLIVITTYLYVARRRVPEPPAPTRAQMDPGVGATRTAARGPAGGGREPTPGNPVSRDAGRAGGSAPAAGDPAGSDPGSAEPPASDQ